MNRPHIIPPNSGPSLRFNLQTTSNIRANSNNNSSNTNANQNNLTNNNSNQQEESRILKLLQSTANSDELHKDNSLNNKDINDPTQEQLFMQNQILSQLRKIPETEFVLDEWMFINNNQQK